MMDMSTSYLGLKLKNPLVVGLTTAPERLVQIRRNRLLSLNETTQTAYVDEEKVEREVTYARRMFADSIANA